MEVGITKIENMNNLKLIAIIALMSFVVLIGCSDDEDTSITGNFTVTIENVFEGKDYFSNGVTGLIDAGHVGIFFIQCRQRTLYKLCYHAGTI